MSRQFNVRKTNSGYEVSEVTGNEGVFCGVGCIVVIIMIGLIVGIMTTPEILMEMFINPVYYFVALLIVIMNSIILYKNVSLFKNSVMRLIFYGKVGWVTYLVESSILTWVLFLYNISNYFSNYYDRDFFTDIIMVISELSAFFVVSLIYVLVWTIVASIIVKMIQKIK